MRECTRNSKEKILIRNKILFFSRDPGAANVVSSLVKRFVEEGFIIELYGKDYALKKYEQFSLNARDVNCLDDVSSEQGVLEFIKRVNPDFIITGTSADDFTEKWIWSSAKKLNITTFAIIDQWMNYGIRFSKYTIREMQKFELNKEYPFLPDYIGVMDDFSFKQAEEEGLPSNRLLVVGQPYFDYLRQYSLYNAQTKRIINDKLIQIIYVSEPITDCYSIDDNNEYPYGYNEIDIFNNITNVICSIVKGKPIDVTVTVKIHPRENSDKYIPFLNQLNVENIKINIDNTSTVFELADKVDLVMGMSSMFLLESAVLGIPVKSVQIGLNREDPFILSCYGVNNTIRSMQELTDFLIDVLINHKIDELHWEINEDSINRIISKVRDLLWRS